MEFDIEAVDDLESAMDGADVICCATLATEPLIHGRCLRPGQHLDLVGAFTPQMREADTEAMARAEVFVDTRAGATSEAGEIVQAMASGMLRAADIRAELAELVRGGHPGRSADDSITVFKSVGTAIEDLAAARLVLANAG
jgi:ornithine cyclodeaminase